MMLEYQFQQSLNKVYVPRLKVYVPLKKDWMLSVFPKPITP